MVISHIIVINITKAPPRPQVNRQANVRKQYRVRWNSVNPTRNPWEPVNPGPGRVWEGSSGRHGSYR